MRSNLNITQLPLLVLGQGYARCKHNVLNISGCKVRFCSFLRWYRHWRAFFTLMLVCVVRVVMWTLYLKLCALSVRALLIQVESVSTWSVAHTIVLSANRVGCSIACKGNTAGGSGYSHVGLLESWRGMSASCKDLQPAYQGVQHQVTCEDVYS